MHVCIVCVFVRVFACVNAVLVLRGCGRGGCTWCVHIKAHRGSRMVRAGTMVIIAELLGMLERTLPNPADKQEGQLDQAEIDALRAAYKVV